MGEIPAGDDWSSNSGLRSGTRVDSTVDLSVQHPVRLRKSITCTVYKIQYTVHIPLIALSSSPSVLQNQSLGRGESTVGSAFPSGISLLERPQRAGETVEDARVVSPFSNRPYYCRLADVFRLFSPATDGAEKASGITGRAQGWSWWWWWWRTTDPRGRALRGRRALRGAQRRRVWRGRGEGAVA